MDRHRCVWISAPAGSGKTTLAASHAAVRGSACLWYQLDARDADPAAFFYYLREAVRRLTPRRRDRLPLFTPEYALGLDAYVHYFWEQLGQLLPPGTCLALDDYHEVPETAALHGILARVLPTLPPGIQTLVSSRSAPPATFARAIATGQMGVLDPEALLLTLGETRALARRRQGQSLPEAEARVLHSRMGGWMAGTVLLLEAPDRVLPPPRASETAEQQLLFDYFAAEIFDRLPAGEQRVLMYTALLPEVTVTAAEQLASEPRAGEVLADLVRRSYFTLRLSGALARYRYHGLFREFLITRARQVLGRDAWSEHVERAARLLAATGSVEHAAQILLDAGRVDALAELIRAQAPALTQQGRLALLEGWLRALPEPLLETDPWLSYWLGVCSFAAFSEARAHLERSYRTFKAADDIGGMLVAWGAFVATFFYIWDDFRPLDPWILEMTHLRRRVQSFPSIEVEARVTAGMFASLVWRYSTHPELAYWRQRAFALLDSAAAPETRMQMATSLAIHATSWLGDYAATGSVLERTRPLLEDPAVTPVTQMLWFVMEAHHRARLGDSTQSFHAVERGLAIAQERGVFGLNHIVAIQGVWAGLFAGDLQAARRYHVIAMQGLGEAKANGAHFHLLGAWISLLEGDLSRARAQAEHACTHAEPSGADIARPWTNHTLAQVLIESGETERALALLEDCRAWSHEVGDQVALQHVLLSIAYAHIKRDRVADALPFLRDGLRLRSERGYVYHPWISWRKDVLSTLAAVALAHDIEPIYVRDQIRTLGLEPPLAAQALEQWPWPVEVRMLGRFELRRHGEPLPLGRKVPRKPLELLRALIAFGGEDVREGLLIDALWPETDGDSGAHALEVASSRLRKLLGVPDVLVRRNRRLSLDPSRCWVDALVLSRLLDRALGASAELRPSELLARVDAVSSLYRGPLVGVAEYPDAADPLRDRLRSRLSRFLQLASPEPAQNGPGMGRSAQWVRLCELDPELR